MQEKLDGTPKPPSVDDILGQKHPEKKFKAGPISATIWKNQGKSMAGEPTEFFTVSFDRVFKDKKTGEWKHTSSLRQADLPKAILVLNKAYEYLALSDTNVEGLY
jgi:hypothetical protein